MTVYQTQWNCDRTHLTSTCQFGLKIMEIKPDTTKKNRSLSVLPTLETKRHEAICFNMLTISSMCAAFNLQKCDYTKNCDRFSRVTSDKFANRIHFLFLLYCDADCSYCIPPTMRDNAKSSRLRTALHEFAYPS